MTAGIRPDESLYQYHDRVKAEEAVGLHAAPRRPLTRADERMIAKAVRNIFGTPVNPWPDPRVRRVQPDQVPGTGSLGTAVTNPSPESEAAGWRAGGPYMRLSDPARPGLAGHSDDFQPRARLVEDSARQDPQLSQAGARGADFTAEPVTPFDRGGPVQLDDLGKTISAQEMDTWLEFAQSADPVLAAEAQRRIRAMKAAGVRVRAPGSGTRRSAAPAGRDRGLVRRLTRVSDGTPNGRLIEEFVPKAAGDPTSLFKAAGSKKATKRQLKVLRRARRTVLELRGRL